MSRAMSVSVVASSLALTCLPASSINTVNTCVQRLHHLALQQSASRWCTSSSSHPCFLLACRKESLSKLCAVPAVRTSLCSACFAHARSWPTLQGCLGVPCALSHELMKFSARNDNLDDNGDQLLLDWAVFCSSLAQTRTIMKPSVKLECQIPLVFPFKTSHVCFGKTSHVCFGFRSSLVSV